MGGEPVAAIVAGIAIIARAARRHHVLVDPFRL
jgi:hypothetical protein